MEEEEEGEEDNADVDVSDKEDLNPREICATCGSPSKKRKISDIDQVVVIDRKMEDRFSSELSYFLL
jgi:hypothetical protein